jgi:hypothetical protein
MLSATPLDDVLPALLFTTCARLALALDFINTYTLTRAHAQYGLRVLQLQLAGTCAVIRPRVVDIVPRAA